MRPSEPWKPWLLGFAAIISLAPTQARADAIIPYMVVPWGQVFLFPLVVVVEAVVLRAMLGGRAFAALGQSLLVNLASTLVGAVLYFTTMGWLHERLFDWWAQGGLGAGEALRNACIALGFAAALWLVSWLLESSILGRMRKADRTARVWRSCAVANSVTYVGLLGLAVWFDR